MECLRFLVIIAVLLFGICCVNAQETPEPVWTDALDLTLEGRGWDETPGSYHRLPTKSVGVVRGPVTDLAACSTGMLVRFITDSTSLHVRWKLLNANLAMPHMPATGVSGVDLYVREDGRFRWLAAGRPSGVENTSKLIDSLSPQPREYALYLPLYNGVESVEIGLNPDAILEAAPSRVKPVVFYGTSITQGGCASRPGMAYPAIIGRMLNVPIINLGFSGNGRLEPEMVDLLAELDASVFVIDPLPNMSADQIDERFRYLLTVLKEKRPGTPVVLVESVSFQHEFILQTSPTLTEEKNQTLRKVYEDVAEEWDGRLFYVDGAELLGDDGEGTVDGIHPTDLGFLRMAEILAPVIKEAAGN